MDSASWTQIINELEKCGLRFEPGLGEAEVSDTENRFQFWFPPDLRAFLQTALPVGDGFPNWRTDDESVLRDWLDIPRQGVLFDVESNDFWLPEWGPRPALLKDALQVASDLIVAAPKLIPIYLHRMMPEQPRLAGNPVFSVHQTDIIYYGFDLEDYLRHEFGLSNRKPWPDQVRPIPFWDIERFCDIRWSDGPCVFDNSGGLLP
jgi:hypothetical protein